MARQKNNAVMHNAHGMFAKQVLFKERAGKVYLSGPANTKEPETGRNYIFCCRFPHSVSYLS